MPICGIFGCSNRPSVNKEFSYYKTPKIITGEGEETEKLSEERRRLWKAAVGRKDIQTEEKWERTIVCSKHFVGGAKAYLHDRTNPGWLPSLELGQPESLRKRTPSPVFASDRYQRASQRKIKRKESEAVSSLLFLKKRRIDFSKDPSSDLSPTTPSDCETPTNCEASACENQEQDSTCEREIQTEMTSEAIGQLEEDNQARIQESGASTTFGSKDLYSFECYKKDEEKVVFFTGLPNVGVLMLLFSMIESHIGNMSRVLTKENEFLLCLVKMRMNYLFKDIAYNLNVSVATVQRSFHSTLSILYTRLDFLISWPSRECLRKSMPMCFRKDFGKKVVVVLDCFELFTERPSSSLNKVFTYSNYKHHQTVKYLIGIAPHGVVTFISDGWGGRTSDKHITEKSGVLDNLLPGDIVMVDRGFNIQEAVNFYQAELAIPSFTRGKTQLHPVEVENTRRIASVRIHVERVIGLIMRKFRIFEGTIPLEFVKLRTGETVPTIDKLVKVACCLTNLCTSVVPFE